MTPHAIEAGIKKPVAVIPPEEGTSRSDREVAGGTSRSDREVVIFAPAVSLCPALASDPVGTALHWIDGARKAEVMGAFSRIMAGFALRAVREELNVKQGARTDQSADERLAGGWKGFLKDHAGISDDAAGNWMKLSKLAEPRIKKMGGIDPATLLNLAAADATTITAVSKTMAKLFEGQSYGQLALELGLVKAKHGSKGTGGNKKKGDGEAAELDPENPPADWQAEEWREHCGLPAAAQAESYLIHELLLGMEGLGLEPKRSMLWTDGVRARVRAAAQTILDQVPAVRGPSRTGGSSAKRK